MVKAFWLALDDFADPALRRWVWLSLGASLLGLMALVAGFEAVLLRTETVETTGWLETLLDVLGGLGATVIAILLFPAVAGAVSGLLGDQVVEAVERRRYPSAPPVRPMSWPAALGAALRFFGVVLLVNLAILPFHLVPGVSLVLFFAANGYLMGREYFELVALRRLDAPAARFLRRRHRLTVFVAGLIVTGLLAVPLLNLLVPVFAAAFLTHIFWRLART